MLGFEFVNHQRTRGTFTATEMKSKDTEYFETKKETETNT